jgi:hypothetical protein
MNRIVLAFACLTASAAQAAPHYHVTFLETPGGAAMNAFGLNNNGDIAGGAGDGDAYQAYLRTASGSYQALGGFGGTRSTASAIADNGTIAGQARTGATGATSVPFVGRAGEPLAPIALPEGAGFAISQDVNESGLVVGTYRSQDGSPGQFAFRWSQADGLQTLTSVGTARNITLFGVNEAGTAVGSFYDGHENPIRWEADGSITLLQKATGVPTDFYNDAFVEAINDDGLAVGSIAASGTGGAAGFVDTNLLAVWGADGKLARTASVGSEFGQGLTAINRFGDTVGYTSLVTFDPDTQAPLDRSFALLWLAGEDPLDLNTLLDDKSLILRGTLGINDKRQIIAYGFRDGMRFDVLLTPVAVPEPASWAMMIAGFAMAGAAARGRRGVRLAA